MKPPTAVIAEDEPHLREELRESLVALWPELEIVGEAENGIEALHLLNWFWCWVGCAVGYDDDRSALAGMVQTMLMTKHM